LALKSILKRGFKAEAERTAVRYRKELDLPEIAPLCAFKLADHLSIEVCKATEFLSLPEEASSMQAYDFGWSALAMIPASGKKIIIHNPFSTPARQQSDVMHELSHIICGHTFNDEELDFEVPMGMRSYNELFEEEAKCLGSCLQITREGLLWGLRKKMTNHQLSEHFNASIEMIEYRVRMTGVNRQFSYYSRSAK
jgi:Zn-dependent peptidase ImmA (M78 family)